MFRQQVLSDMLAHHWNKGVWYCC